MALTRSFIQNAAMTALDARFFTASMLQKNSDNSVRLGQLWGSAVAVAPTASMTVTVADGSYWVLGRGVSDGAVVVANNGTATVTIPTAPASNSRCDSVYVKHDDSTFGDPDSLPVFGVVSGTAAASPSIPAVPTGAFRLATVLVPSGVTATNASGVVVTNTYAFAALSGSPIRYRSVAEMLADAAAVPDGVFGYIKGGGFFYMRGGVWRREDASVFAFAAQTASTALATGTTPILLGGSSPSAAQSNDTQFFDVPTVAALGPVKVAGWYEITGQVQWATNSTGERFIEVQQNDTSLVPQIADRRAASGTSNQGVVGQIFLSVGDYIKFKGWQSSGGSLNYVSRIQVKLLSA